MSALLSSLSLSLTRDGARSRRRCPILPSIHITTFRSAADIGEDDTMTRPRCTRASTRNLQQFSPMLTNDTFNRCFLKIFFNFAYFFFCLFTFLRPLSSPIGARERGRAADPGEVAGGRGRAGARAYMCHAGKRRGEGGREASFGAKQGQRWRRRGRSRDSMHGVFDVLSS